MAQRGILGQVMCLGSRICQCPGWGPGTFSSSTDIFSSSTYFSLCEMNPSGFSPLRNFLVVALYSGKLSGGREGHISPLLRPPRTTGPGSPESRMVLSGGRRALWQTLNQLNTSEPSGGGGYINFSSLTK